MAKNGFSISNRRAVTEITASTTLTADDCGKVIELNNSSAITLTLPTPASAGAGWNCIVKIAPGSQGDHSIQPGSPTMHTVGMTSDVSAGSDLPGSTGAIEMTGANLNAGDSFTLVTDGEDWYAKTMVFAINAYAMG